jgi:hypothetical protein
MGDVSQTGHAMPRYGRGMPARAPNKVTGCHYASRRTDHFAKKWLYRKMTLHNFTQSSI